MTSLTRTDSALPPKTPPDGESASIYTPMHQIVIYSFDRLSADLQKFTRSKSHAGDRCEAVRRLVDSARAEFNNTLSFPTVRDAQLCADQTLGSQAAAADDGDGGGGIRGDSVHKPASGDP